MKTTTFLIRCMIMTALGSMPPLATAQEEAEGPVASALRKAGSEFNRGVDELLLAYRKRVADLITKATRVEVCLLDFSLGGEKRTAPAQGMFNVGPGPFSKETAILASHACTAGEMKELLPLLSQALTGMSAQGGYGCHFPVHGLRVWIGEEVAFQTSICWYCCSFGMDYGKGPVWVNHTPGFKDLKPVLLRLIPIPEDEVTRFKKDHDAGPAGQ